MNSLAKAGRANQSAAEMPAGAATISGSLSLRCEQQSWRSQGNSCSDVRPERSCPLNRYSRLVRAVLLEQHEHWQLEVRRMFPAESMAAIPDLGDIPALLSASA